VSKLESCKSKK